MNVHHQDNLESFHARDLPHTLLKAAEAHGDKPLIRFDDKCWSYAQAPNVAARIAGKLSQVGLAAGDRVAIFLSNRIEFMEIFLGCAWLGAIAVPINTASRGEQLRHILSNSGARLIVAEADFLPIVTDACADLPIERLWIVGVGKPAGRGRIIVEPFASDGSEIKPSPVRPGDNLAILYTVTGADSMAAYAATKIDVCITLGFDGS